MQLQRVKSLVVIAGWEISPIPDDVYWKEWPSHLRLVTSRFFHEPLLTHRNLVTCRSWCICTQLPESEAKEIAYVSVSNAS